MLNFPLALISATSLFAIYYKVFYGKKPKIYWKKNSNWHHFLSNHVSFLKSKYWSFCFVPGGKLQTILAAVLPKGFQLSYYKETITTPDGGEFILAWANHEDIHLSNKPIVFIYPGLVSTTNTTYVKELSSAIVEKGYAVVVLVNRGLETPCLTEKAFCATHTADIDQAVSIIEKRYHNSPISAIGISLGGLVLTRYLSLKGSECKILSAFVYSCPFNPVEGSANIEKWHNWLLYNIALTKGLKEVYLRSKEKFLHVVDHSQVMGSKSIREIDSHFTAKVFGYETVDHYYEDAVITAEMLNKIRVPTLALCADDDAFAPVTSLPCDAVSQTDFVALALTRGGGHVGHLCGINPFSTPYYIHLFINYIEAVFHNQSELPSTKL